MASERAETLLVLLRIRCLVSFAASFTVSPVWYIAFVCLMVATLAQMHGAPRGYTISDLQVVREPQQPRDNNIIWLVVIKWVLMLATFGTAWSAVTVFLRRDSGLCSRVGFPPKVCPMYEATAALALVAGYLNLVIAVGMLWVEGSHHHAN